MEVVCFIVDRERALKNVMDLLLGARESVFISVDTVNFSALLHHNRSLLSILEKICKTCVVNILVSEDGIVCDESSDKINLPKLPTNCNVKFVKNSGPSVKSEFLPWTPTLKTLVKKNLHDKKVENFCALLQKGIYKHNQSYILIDTSILLFGSSFFKTLPSASVHAPLCVCRSTKEFVDFSHNNWIAGGWKDYMEEEEEKQEDEEKIAQLIETARNYCYIETPLFLSHYETTNKIAQSLVKRLVRIAAASNNGEDDPFQCVILVNVKHIESTIFEGPIRIGKKLNYTLEYIIAEIQKAGIDPAVFHDRLFIGYLNKTEIHSSVVIQDGVQCFLSSSSLTDRSLCRQNSEILIEVSDTERIETLQTLLWSKHTNENNGNLHFVDFFDMCVAQQGNIVKHKLWMDPVHTTSFKCSDLIAQTVIGKCSFT